MSAPWWILCFRSLALLGESGLVMLRSFAVRLFTFSVVCQVGLDCVGVGFCAS